MKTVGVDLSISVVKSEDDMPDEENREKPSPREKQPLRFHTRDYNGKEAGRIINYTRRIENNDRVEQYLNSIMTPDSQTVTVFDIAQELGMAKEDVSKVLTENRVGRNTITF